MRPIDYTPLEVKSRHTPLKTLRTITLCVLGAMIITTIIVLIFGEKALPAIPLWIIAIPYLRRFGIRNMQQNTDSIRNRLAAFAKANNWKFSEVEIDDNSDLFVNYNLGNFKPDKGMHFVIEGTVGGSTFKAVWLRGSPAHVNWTAYRTIIQAGGLTASVAQMALYPQELRPLFGKAGLDNPSQS